MKEGTRKIHLVVTCTSRKKKPPHPDLTIGGGSDTLGREPWKAWQRRLEVTEAPVMPAQDLYVGQHWYLARTLTAGRSPDVEIELWISSAGYGLVQPDACLKSYSAVFTPGLQDSVSRVMPDRNHRDATRRWWKALAEWEGPTKGRPRRIADLARRDPHSVILLALSPAYLDACSDDMIRGSINLADPDRLLIVCPGSRPGNGRELPIQPLPVDARAAGFLGGTMGTLGVRFVRHLLSEYAWDDLRASALRPRLERWLSTLTPRSMPVRTRHDDADVTAFVRAALVADYTRSATSLLREYRHRGEACEQRRFHLIFASVKEETSAHQ